MLHISPGVLKIKRGIDILTKSLTPYIIVVVPNLNRVNDGLAQLARVLP